MSPKPFTVVSPLTLSFSHSGCRSREEKGSHDLCRWCRVPAGLPHPGRRRGPRGPAVPRQHQRGVHVVLAGPPTQLRGRQEPGGPEQHPQGGHRTAARRPHGSPEEQVLQQPRQHVAGLRCCWTTGNKEHGRYCSNCNKSLLIQNIIHFHKNRLRLDYSATSYNPPEGQ